MNLASHFRKASAWALALGCALAFVRCADEQVAGSSVTTGNPTEIQVSLTDAGGGPVALTGRVEVYAATQIPVPGFRPDPLARFDVPGRSTFTLNAGHFEGIADSVWASGSLEGDSLARFNLVITGADKGALLGDLKFRLKEGTFSLKAGASTAGQGGAVKIGLSLSDMVTYKATLPPGTLVSDKNHFLFLYGTGYSAKGDSGRFVFPAMPSGTREPALVSIPTKESQATSPQDSATVYRLDRPLATGDNPSAAGEKIGKIRIPDSLK